MGGLNLFTTTPGALDEDALAIGQALADVATIALLHERASRERNVMIEQMRGRSTAGSPSNRPRASSPHAPGSPSAPPSICSNATPTTTTSGCSTSHTPW